jgi:hypothetical protein
VQCPQEDNFGRWALLTTVSLGCCRVNDSHVIDRQPSDPGRGRRRRSRIHGNGATANSDPGLSWHHLATLNQRTSLPVLVKGILHPDDARRVFGLGLDGIVVSNHGGRQVDSAVAALDALVAVRHAVGSEPGRDQVLKRENTRLRSWP